MVRDGCFALTLLVSLAASGQGTTSQQINILPIPDQTYGVAPFQIIALASPSYLPVTLAVQGPASLNGRWLTITGTGTVTITAQQSGNADYAPASAQQQFTVLPGMPSIQAQAATIVYGTPFDSSIFYAAANAVPAADPSADIPTVTSALDTSPLTGNSAADVTVSYNSPVLRYEAAEMVEITTAIGLKALAADPTVVADLL